MCYWQHFCTINATIAQTSLLSLRFLVCVYNFYCCVYFFVLVLWSFIGSVAWTLVWRHLETSGLVFRTVFLYYILRFFVHLIFASKCSTVLVGPYHSEAGTFRICNYPLFSSFFFLSFFSVFFSPSLSLLLIRFILLLHL